MYSHFIVFPLARSICGIIPRAPHPKGNTEKNSVFAYIYILLLISLCPSQYIPRTSVYVCVCCCGNLSVQQGKIDIEYTYTHWGMCVCKKNARFPLARAYTIYTKPLQPNALSQQQQQQRVTFKRKMTLCNLLIASHC